MKWMIASDIHGSAKYCELMMQAFQKEQADMLLLLGDLLYHGPRNDLPEDYAPKKVISMLNTMSSKIVCVRGNCDCEVDQMVLNFPIMADYVVLDTGKKLIYATHGHHWNEKNPLPMPAGSVLLCGHTHVPKNTDYKGFSYMNPGSVSLPKENSFHSYMVENKGIFVWKNLLTDEEYIV